MTARPPAVELDGVTRVYPRGKGLRRRDGWDTVALDAVSLGVRGPCIHGLLGPNGAGKTTLVKILATILLPTRGTARVMGHDVVDAPAKVRPLIGLVLGGDRGLYTRLTGRQNLRYWAALYRLQPDEARRRVDRLLDRMGLMQRADERVETYSRGMKQRLHLARGLIGDPLVVVLDEPTSGLDPIAVRAVRELVLELRAAGRTILLATHDMAEADAVCDEVSFIDHGRLLATEAPGALGDRLARFDRIDADAVPPAVVDDLRRLPGVDAVKGAAGSTIRVEVTSDAACVAVLQRLVNAGVTSLRTSKPGLDEVYLHVMKDRGIRV